MKIGFEDSRFLTVAAFEGFKFHAFHLPALTGLEPLYEFSCFVAPHGGHEGLVYK